MGFQDGLAGESRACPSACWRWRVAISLPCRAEAGRDDRGESATNGAAVPSPHGHARSHPRATPTRYSGWHHIPTRLPRWVWWTLIPASCATHGAGAPPPPAERGHPPDRRVGVAVAGAARFTCCSRRLAERLARARCAGIGRDTCGSALTRAQTPQHARSSARACCHMTSGPAPLGRSADRIPGASIGLIVQTRLREMDRDRNRGWRKPRPAPASKNWHEKPMEKM